MALSDHANNMDVLLTTGAVTPQPRRRGSRLEQFLLFLAAVGAGYLIGWLHAAVALRETL